MLAILEHDYRTPTWTPGPAITLADGSDWYLPRFDLALLATQPDLLDAIRRVLWVASELATLDLDSPARPLLETARFEDYRALADQFLQLNYDLPPTERETLLPPERGRWFAPLACQLGDAIVLATIEEWRGVAFSFCTVETEAILSN